jgi:hypothetical protein
LLAAASAFIIMDSDDLALTRVARMIGKPCANLRILSAVPPADLQRTRNEEKLLVEPKQVNTKMTDPTVWLGDRICWRGRTFG